MIIINLISALLLTEAVEFAAAYFMGYRGREFYITLALVNIITNPLLNYILIVLCTFKLLHFPLITVLILEISVIVGEWRILSYAMGKKGKTFLGLSIVMNISSYLTGILIFGFK